MVEEAGLLRFREKRKKEDSNDKGGREEREAPEGSL
jgi:hypothetical protein